MEKINKFVIKIVDPFTFEGGQLSPSGKMIIKHKDWSYNEDHELIVVDGEVEDRQAIIDEAAKTCGLKTILKTMVTNHDVVGLRGLALTDDQCGDTRIESQMNIDSVRKATQVDEKAAEKVAATFGKTKDELLSISRSELDKLIQAKVDEVLQAKTPVKEGKVNE